MRLVQYRFDGEVPDLDEYDVPFETRVLDDGTTLAQSTELVSDANATQIERDIATLVVNEDES